LVSPISSDWSALQICSPPLIIIPTSIISHYICYLTSPAYNLLRFTKLILYVQCLWIDSADEKIFFLYIKHNRKSAEHFSVQSFIIYALHTILLVLLNQGNIISVIKSRKAEYMEHVALMREFRMCT
jgi:hypothetical protein